MGAGCAAVLLVLGAANWLGMLPNALVTWERTMARKLGLVPAAVLVAATAGAPGAPPVPPTQLGANLAPPYYWGGTRPFANLAVGATWFTNNAAGGGMDLPPEYLDPHGNLISMPPAGQAALMLIPPLTGPEGVTIRCTYQGSAEVMPQGPASDIRSKAHSVEFHWKNDPSQLLLIQLIIKGVKPSDPFRDVDCREPSLPPTQQFAPDYVDYVSKFKVIRFMDWQQTNLNAKVTWATRNPPGALRIHQNDGIAVEDMVALAIKARTDAWFTVPWNADDDYVGRFAQYVHDHLPADRVVYVELSNEVWNTGFGQAQQAIAEGTAQKLSTDPTVAGLYRYAEQSAHVLDIWSRVFADRPTRLVRVLSSQNIGWRVEQMLAFRDTARHIDAVATAPYFGFDLGRGVPFNGLDQGFTALQPMVKASLDASVQAKAVATKYGKRYLAYEAGQHVLLGDIAMVFAVARDQRMHDLYKSYIDDWRARVGDTMMLFSASGAIGGYGAWGLKEYDTQPAAAAPKWRAVEEALQR